MKNQELKLDYATKKQNFMEEMIEWAKTHDYNKDILAKQKIKLCKKHGLKKIPTDIEIYLNAKQEDTPLLTKLKTKPIRELSGVCVVAIMGKPIGCAHGKCIMCPGGPKSKFGDVPMSYTGIEPATRRAIRNDYDSYLQTFNRLEQYIASGQTPQKIEMIIMGGTFPSFIQEYQNEFMYYAYKAMNDFGRLFIKDGKVLWDEYKEFFEMPGDFKDEAREQRIKQKIIDLKYKDADVKKLEEAKAENEIGEIRLIGLTFETRPDYARELHINDMLKFGVTRVELGVQSTKDDVLKYINRDHDSKSSKESIALLKDAGFKLNFHMMPGLPLTRHEEDVDQFREIFEDPDYKPDMMKIYPCTVIIGTKLYDMYVDGEFEPISTEEAAEIIAKAMKYVPNYTRIMRVQRDIPSTRITAGPSRTNLRQYVLEAQKKLGIKSNDIRAREPGHQKKDIVAFPRGGHDPEYKIVVQEYESSGGKEYFISYDDVANDLLFGFIRLRFFGPHAFRDEINPETDAIIRELHVYGKALLIGKDGKEEDVQHIGIGKKLLAKAEEICKQHGKKKLLVISGVGVKQYYKKQGYSDDGPYVSKTFN